MMSSGAVIRWSSTAILRLREASGGARRWRSAQLDGCPTFLISPPLQRHSQANARAGLVLVAPVGTPDAIVQLSDDLRLAITDPHDQDQAGNDRQLPIPMTPSELLAFIHDEQQMRKPVLEQIARNP